MSKQQADLNSHIKSVTERIIKRSSRSRKAYLARMAAAKNAQPPRSQYPCGNFAHGIAACSEQEKLILKSSQQPNIAIVTAYNDMLSAHQPYHCYPDLIKKHIGALGGVAQVAGGVPAMCDGVTQGQPGMDLSLFSRDVIAMATAVALSHNLFDGALLLGICDKIVPGLLIGALSFGYLPMSLVPAGPMPSGLPNSEKARVRQQYALGEVGREELLAAETASYHSPGTCTFYGTANTNQMMLEIMGLQLPSSSFVNPNTPLRDALTKYTCENLFRSIQQNKANSLAEIVCEKSIVNGVIGLLATGGSTNHTLHLIAIAKAAGIQLRWEDMAELSEVIPLLARVYPNGKDDVNAFHNAGGMGFIITELLNHGLLHADVKTVLGQGLHNYCQQAELDVSNNELKWCAASAVSKDMTVLKPVQKPFSDHGGLRLLEGNLGKAVIKTSAVKSQHQIVEAPAKVFQTQMQVINAFEKGELSTDVVVVLIGQGPRANGMPELHKLTPALGALQDKGFNVALVTDGRMSGASGKVPSAIHVCPEALDGGAIGKVRDGDMICLNANTGELSVRIDDTELKNRRPQQLNTDQFATGCGRELFAPFRDKVGSAEEGATVFADFLLDGEQDA